MALVAVKPRLLSRVSRLRWRLANSGSLGATRCLNACNGYAGVGLNLANWPYNTGTWKRLRLAILRQEPTCRECRRAGQTTLAHDVDHITPLSQGGAPFSPGNLQPLCRACHNAKINREEGGAFNPPRDRRVDPQTGKPLDADHWWNAGEKLLSTESQGPVRSPKDRVI